MIGVLNITTTYNNIYNTVSFIGSLSLIAYPVHGLSVSGSYTLTPILGCNLEQL